jgi:hypothetical protein
MQCPVANSAQPPIPAAIAGSCETKRHKAMNDNQYVFSLLIKGKELLLPLILVQHHISIAIAKKRAKTR